MPAVLEVVAEPNRRQILELLLTGERAVGELVEALALSQPSVSKHLWVLRDAGVGAVRQDAQHRRYRLRPGPLQEIDEWLTPLLAGVRSLAALKPDVLDGALRTLIPWDLQRRLDAEAPARWTARPTRSAARAAAWPTPSTT